MVLCLTKFNAIHSHFSQNTTISYAQIVSGNTDDSNGAEMFPSDAHSQSHEYMESTLCPYIHSTITRSDGSWSCKYGELCKYQHGDLCEMCGLYCLHPIDQKQRKAHEKVWHNIGVFIFVELSARIQVKESYF